MLVYLDNAATTRPLTGVCDAVAEAMRSLYGNANSPHFLGEAAKRALRASSDAVLSVLGTSDGHVVWTSGGSESNQLVMRRLGQGGAVVSAVEHMSILSENPLATVSLNEQAWSLPADGLLRATKLFSMMLVNNETGSLQPVVEFAQAIKQRAPDVLIHCDAVAAFGKVDLAPIAAVVDAISMSSHKIHGPKGIGALWLGPRIDPSQFADIDKRSKPVPTIVGTRYAIEHFSKERLAFVDKWRQWSETLRKTAQQAGGYQTAPQSCPHILSVAFPNHQAMALCSHLESRGVIVSTRSACQSSSAAQSHVLAAMQIPPSHGVLRISFGYDTTDAEIDHAAAALASALAR